MRTVRGIVAAGFLLVLCAGGAPAASAATESERSGSAFDRSRCAPSAPDEAPGALADYGRFGVELLAAISNAGERNALVSPLGAATVLAMAAEGASDPMRRAIREVLRRGEAARDAEDSGPGAAGMGSAGDEAAGDPGGSAAGTDEPANAAPGGKGPGAALLCRLAAMASAAGEDAGIELRTANGAFAAHRFALYPAFVSALRDRFGARVEAVDFADSAAVDRINAWAERETEGMVPVLLDTPDPAIVLVLANAMYFQGEWTQPFDPARTAPLPFRTGTGASVDAVTMRADDVSARYREDESFQALSLPYGDGGFALVLVLPRAGIAPSDALRRLASDPSWLSERGFHPARGYLSLPRATLNGDYDLLPTLETFGLDAALRDPGAFARMSPRPPSLSAVTQRTTLVLDEKGTEAAAVSAAILTKSRPERFEMRVDRPFALALRHLDTGVLLFAAWVSDPTVLGTPASEHQ